MKSSFLLTMLLSSLVSFSAMGQTNRTRRVQPKPAASKATAKPAVKTKTAPPTQTSTQSVATTEATTKSPFQRFYDRLSIGYFGVYTSPTLEDWNSANAATSPAFGDTERKCRKNCDTYAMNIWNQVNFAYDFGWIMKFVFIPRWTVYLDNPVDMNRSAGEDRALLGIEDFLVGFAGSIVTSEDKKFNWFARPAMRLPTSHFSRNNTNGTFGDLTHQFEVIHFITYDPNPTWQLGLIAQQRWWIYEDRYRNSRLRYYTSPYISYAPNEKTKIQVYYQSMIENNKRDEDIGLRQKPNYRDVYQDVMLAVGRDVTPTLNIMPYLGVFVDDIPLSMRSAYLGAWFSWKIK